MYNLKTFFFLFVAFSAFTVTAQSMRTYEQDIPGTGLNVRMVFIPSGNVLIGSDELERGRDADEGPQKNVQLSSFWIGEHEVTFAQWDAFFKNMDIPQTKNIAVDAISRPTAQYIDLTWGMGRDSRQPTNSMSQTAALMFCKWLYENTGKFYRLPTEAEWEFACKAGATNKGFGSDGASLESYGYFRDNSGGKFHKVKELKPNAAGLYDMLGNLSEWTLDQYDPAAFAKLPDNAHDPVVLPASKYPKVVKGGSYLDEAKELRCSNRIPLDASWNKRDPQIPKSKWWLTDGMTVGFRIVCPEKQPGKEEIEKFFAQYLK